jgi:hypothetical protein
VLYREVRLEALLRNPEAYSSTYEAEAGQSLTWFADRLAGSAVFGAFSGGDLLGIASFLIPLEGKEGHKGMLAGMYVPPAEMKQFKSAGQAQRFLSAHDQINNLFHLRRDHVTAADHRAFFISCSPKSSKIMSPR